MDEDGQVAYIQHVAVPSQADIEALLLERKKNELAEKYVGSALVEQAKVADAIVGFERFAHDEDEEGNGD